MADKDIRKAVTPEELRRRATGGKVPMSATPTPGVRGTPPLPAGKPVRVEKGVARTVSMTEVEKDVLKRAGWREGEPVPANMADIIDRHQAELGDVGAAAAQEAVYDLPLPLDPSTPPLKVNTVDIKSLSPTRQAEIRQEMKAALQKEEQAQREAANASRMRSLPESVQAAKATAEAAAVSQRRPPVRVGSARPVAPPVEIEDDLAVYDEIVGRLPASERPQEALKAVGGPKAAPIVQTPPAKPQARQTASQAPARPSLGKKQAPPPVQASIPEQMETQFAAMMAEDGILPAEEPMPELEPEEPPGEVSDVSEKEASDDTGATHVLANCPHCNHALDQPSIPEPAYHEKMAFLHSVLGQKCFRKDYKLFGGAVTVSFRTLTMSEMDAVWARVLSERQQGLIRTEADFWERINRFRLYLQLVTVRSDQFQHDLPDGLSRDTNPLASSFWEDCDMPDPEGPGDRGLAHIEKYLVEKVLATEIFSSVTAVAGSRFNRLVAKMEAMADDSDFWLETGEPS